MNTEIHDAEFTEAGAPVPAQPAQSTALATTADPYMGMAQMAMSQGKIAEMKELLAMKREWDAEEARKLFIAAMAKFKAKGLVVGKDKENKQYGSMYTTLGNLVNTASELMAEFGLSVDWEPDNSKQGQIGITCTLSHEAGHKKSVTLHAEPDKSGAKNPIQQMKSAATYLRGLTFEMVTGIATHDSAGVNLSDDGNATKNGPELITAEQVKILSDLIAAYVNKPDKFMDWIRSAADMKHVVGLAEVPANRFETIHNKLAEIRKQKAEGKA